jgi:hypothetical protein
LSTLEKINVEITKCFRLRHHLVILLGGVLLDEVGGLLKDLEKSVNKNGHIKMQ